MWLFSQLREWFDAEVLFFDQSNIDAGEHFPDAIQSAIAATKVVLVVVGPDWVSTLNARAKEHKVDYVCEEVAQALSQFAQKATPKIIPVLVGDTPMPSVGDKALLSLIAGIDGVPTPAFRVPVEARSLWHVPYRRNLNFTGRDIELTALRDTLEKDRGATLTALSGLGGVGKTQLALEYSYQFAEDYAGIWWFKSESSEVFMTDLLALANVIGIGDRIGDQSELAAAVNVWLGHQTSRWLLVYDNVPEYWPG